jgi:enoyl-CoA hydratase
MKNSPVAITQAINAVNANFKDENGYETEIKSLENAFTEDFKEGTTAFLEKRSSLPGE